MSVGYTTGMGLTHSKVVLPKECQSGLDLEIWDLRRGLYIISLLKPALYLILSTLNGPKPKVFNPKTTFFLSESLHTLKRQNGIIRG